jgi:glycerophosphoryl diester phosphodiesterase
MSLPQVIAHRGASAHAPENTLAAFRLAAELGAGFIETDLRVTREGRFVLRHDTRVNRTTSGRGRVADLAFDAVRRLDAGRWFGEEFAGEHVPSLEEALALAGQLGLGIYLELKVPLDGSLPFALAEQLRRAHRLDRIVVLSFEPAVLATMRTTEPRIATALLVGRTGPTIEAARKAGAGLLAPRYKRISAPLIRRARQAGLGVVAWTVNEREEMRRMLSLGVDGIMTNWPDRLLEEIGQRTSPRPN